MRIDLLQIRLRFQYIRHCDKMGEINPLDSGTRTASCMKYENVHVRGYLGEI